MKTKREVLESIAKVGSCGNINCEECPYDSIRCHDRIFTIGAMALLRMFPKKEKPILEVGTKIRFSDGTVATISKVDCGCLYYHALVFKDKHKEYIDYLVGKTWEIVE